MTAGEKREAARLRQQRSRDRRRQSLRLAPVRLAATTIAELTEWGVLELEDRLGSDAVLGEGLSFGLADIAASLRRLRERGHSVTRLVPGVLCARRDDGGSEE